MNENMIDPVDEIRELRRRMSARFDHDPARLVAYYIELQKEYEERILKDPESPEPTGHGSFSAPPQAEVSPAGLTKRLPDSARDGADQEDQTKPDA